MICPCRLHSLLTQDPKPFLRMILLKQIMIRLLRWFLAPVRHTQNAWMWLFGFDLFIAYRQEDARGYVDALSATLTENCRLEIFVDHLNSPGGSPVREDIRHNGLRRSHAMLVIASPRAIAEPEEITAEISEFRQVHPHRRLMAVEFECELEGLANDHEWVPFFGKSLQQPLWHQDESGVRALATNTPSESVVDYIVASRDRVRRRALARLAGWSVTLSIGVFASAAGVFIYQFIDQSIENRAISQGFEALDRSDFRSAKALALAKSSLQIRDNYAARRVLMTLWAEAPFISRLGFEKGYSTDSFTRLVASESAAEYPLSVSASTTISVMNLLSTSTGSRPMAPQSFRHAAFGYATTVRLRSSANSLQCRISTICIRAP